MPEFTEYDLSAFGTAPTTSDVFDYEVDKKGLLAVAVYRGLSIGMDGNGNANPAKAAVITDNVIPGAEKTALDAAVAAHPDAAIPAKLVSILPSLDKGSAAAIQDLHANSNAVTGRMYFDTDNDLYYRGTSSGKLAAAQMMGGPPPPIQQAAPWQDFRFIDPGTLSLTTSTGVSLVRDALHGYYADVASTSWNQGVRFNDLVFNRNEGKTISLVFCVAASSTQMLGFIGSTVPLDPMTTQPGYYAAEAVAYLSGTNMAAIYGRNSGGNNGYQSIGSTILQTGKFYRLDFPVGDPSLLSANFQIHEVDPEDWDTSLALVKDVALTTVGGNAASVAPFWLTRQDSENQVYLVGAKAA